MIEKHTATLRTVIWLSMSALAFNANAQVSADKPGEDPWRAFKNPTVVVVDKDEGATRGSALVHQLIPNLEKFAQEIALGVCKSLYKGPDEVPAFEQLTLVLEDSDGIAGKSGHPPKIQINLSTRYLERQHKRDGDEAIAYEIAGVIWHELTHGYQHVPQNAGRYRSGTDHYGFIEGSADAVRILAGFHKTQLRRPGGHWTDGYTTTGHFIVWLANNRDPEFLYKLNQSCQTIDPWSWDQACQSISQTSVALLWAEYQWSIKGGGKEAVARFSPESKLICKGQSVQFRNASFNSPVSYAWRFEGGKPATSTKKSPIVIYEKPGKFGVTLVATNKHGKTSARIRSCIRVLNKNGTLTNLTELGGKISHKSRVSSVRGEGVDNLLDKNVRSKFCLKARRASVKYVARRRCELYSYALTSANDAPGRDPENWTLEASSDGTKWAIIDRQADQVFEKRHQTRHFEIDSKKAYKFYRWNLESKRDAIIQFAELELTGIEK